MSSLAERIEALEARVAELENRRGPKSDRPMTEADAERVKVGDLKDLSHKQAAEALGLSYGQVYSARNGYTFRQKA